MTDDRADEIMRHFDVVAEGIRSELRSVADGHGMLAGGQNRLEDGQRALADGHRRIEVSLQVLADSFKNLDEKVEAFRVEVAANFTELRSMIKFSYAKIDHPSALSRVPLCASRTAWIALKRASPDLVNPT